MNKLSISWILSAALAIALAGVVFHFQGVVKDKDAQLDNKNTQLEAAAQKLVTQAAESDAKLREAYEKAERNASAAQKALNDVQAQVEVFAKEASQQIAAANLPEVTIAVSFRKALLSNGNVAVLRNTSSESIGISVTATRPSANRQRTYEVVLDSQRVKEIGEQEGWAFVPGDTLRIEQASHKPRTVVLQ